MPDPRVIKRALDLFRVAAFGTLALPVIALIALSIKLTSRGPMFYGQMRRGRGGGPFMAWKFHSIYADANKGLEH